MHLLNDNPISIQKSIYYLKKNYPIIAPCDTIYGFLGKVHSASSAIKAIKGRGEDKPFLIVAKREDISKISSQKIPAWVDELWPAPLSVIVSASTWYKKHHGGQQTVAVRVPNDLWLSSLLEKIPFPLYSTSVNRSGCPPLNDFDSIVKEFDNEVPLIVQNKSQTGMGVPSTIVDLTVFPYKVVRMGAIQITDEQLNRVN